MSKTVEELKKEVAELENHIEEQAGDFDYYYLTAHNDPTSSEPKGASVEDKREFYSAIGDQHGSLKDSLGIYSIYEMKDLLNGDALALTSAKLKEIEADITKLGKHIDDYFEDYKKQNPERI